MIVVAYPVQDEALVPESWRESSRRVHTASSVRSLWESLSLATVGKFHRARYSRIRRTRWWRRIRTSAESSLSGLRSWDPRRSSRGWSGTWWRWTRAWAAGTGSARRWLALLRRIRARRPSRWRLSRAWAPSVHRIRRQRRAFERKSS